MGLPWNAYYVLTKAEARLTNSKIHPNSGAPNYNIAHNVSDLFADADLHLGEHSLSADEISSNTYNFSEDDGMEFTIADHTLTFTQDGETPLVITPDGIDVDELLVAGAAIDYAYVTGNDAGTGVTAAELEELTDASETILHSHAAVAAPDHLHDAIGDGGTLASKTTGISFTNAITHNVLDMNLNTNTNRGLNITRQANGSYGVWIEGNVSGAAVNIAGIVVGAYAQIMTTLNTPQALFHASSNWTARWCFVADASADTYAGYYLKRGKIGAIITSGTAYRAFGTGTITAGNASVVVANTLISANSLVYMTVGHAATPAGANTNGGIQTTAITAATNFTVSTMDGNVASADIPFCYMIVN